MTALTIGVHAETGMQLRVYAALLPLGVRELDEALAREAADNPWLEIVARPLRGLDGDAIDGMAAQRSSLVEHLDVQLGSKRLARDVLRAARCTIGMLDRYAYLRADGSEISRLADVSEAAAAAGIAAVQRLDPTGVAARSLGERFQLQLAQRPSTSQLAFNIAGELEALAALGVFHFAAQRGIRPDELTHALAELRSCDPDPARDFGHRIDRVYPEIVFARDGDCMAARTDGRFWPEVRLASLGVSRGLSEPMRQARSRARLTIDALARRRTTLDRLAIALLARQGVFLTGKGNTHDLLPLSGRDLARDIGCAESTISRAIAERYAATPFGVIPLRALLARRPGTLALTTAAVRERIRDIVVTAPHLSDDAIARALKLRGIRLARRTVSKYRRDLGLPTLYGRTTL